MERLQELAVIARKNVEMAQRTSDPIGLAKAIKAEAQVLGAIIAADLAALSKQALQAQIDAMKEI